MFKPFPIFTVIAFVESRRQYSKMVSYYYYYHLLSELPNHLLKRKSLSTDSSVANIWSLFHGGKVDVRLCSAIKKQLGPIKSFFPPFTQVYVGGETYSNSLIFQRERIRRYT